MTSKYVWIGLAVGLFLSGLGLSYAVFINTYNPYAMIGNPAMFSQMMGQNPQFSGQYMGYMMQDPQYMNQWMSQNPQYMGQWMGSMMQDPQLRQQMYNYMLQNQDFMYGMMENQTFQNQYMGPWIMQNPNFQQQLTKQGISNQSNNLGSGMMGGGTSMQDMMSPVPEDVIIKVISSQQVPAGKDAQIKLLIRDKNTGQPLSDAQVIFGIEKGAPMTTMEMQGGMFNGKNLGDGKYLAQFKVGDPGYYTLHTHVIPAGKSMVAMMKNHMDIGIIAK